MGVWSWCSGLTWGWSGGGGNSDLPDKVVHGNPQLMVHVHDSTAQWMQVQHAVPEGALQVGVASGRG